MVDNRAQPQQQKYRLKGEGRRAFLENNAYSNLYLALVAGGLFAHSGAATLTFVILRIGAGIESNPLFYLLGPWNFLIFGAAGMIVYYFLLWKSNIPLKLKCLCAAVLTATATFDFSHDLVYFLVSAGGLPGVPHF
ncbi:MAG TPA: hypothetical protein VFF30_14120 [Nitrososphaerales archaeon]|nr:hypothetical protein [Nitrososphaerales archaeon]